MRIISGKYKGRRIQVRGKFTARPTTDFAKEGLFNLLNNRVNFEGLKVLDLFSGTGGISLEFISRNCETVVAIEQNRKQVVMIQKIIQNLGIDNLEVYSTDVFRFILSCHTKFNIIFADPPYEHEKIALIPDLIFEHDLLLEGGMLILEHSAKHQFETHTHYSFQRNYGNVNFSFFERKQE